MKKSNFTIQNQILFFCLIVFIFLLTADQSNAIPAFSRKYKTSCATCHIAFPKLNAFGEAFRRNGYQFPDGGDPEATKEQPISLGSEGNKKAFPDAIWPGAIPGTSPLAIVLAMETTYSPKEAQKWNFNSLEGEFGALAAGTISENISFWGQLSIAEDAVEIERVSVTLDNIFGGYTATANLKIGKFEPDVYSFSNHRNLGSEYSLNTITLGDNMWALEGTQTGLEFKGVIGAGRLGYTLGLVEGSGNLDNSDKDYYAHATYKFGGMRLDGVIPENSAPVSGSQPWEDNSVTVGAFVYRGLATITDQLKDKFTMVGGDVNLSYGRLNLLAAIGHHDDSNPFIDSPDEKGNLNSYMIEAAYIIYPWLIPLGRFESNKANNESIENNKIAGIIEVLMRANLRFGAEFDWVTQPTPSDPNKAEYSFDEIGLSITLGF